MNNIENYCINHSIKESQLLEDIKKFTYENEEAPQMISGPIVGNILGVLIKAMHAKQVLEIGMFTGYSALNMAQFIPKGGTIQTCEIMSRHVKNAQIFFNKSEYKDSIIIHEGDALNTLENFKINTFDLIFIDADKINYIEYYKKSMHLIKSKGVIVLDNMLWGGSVLNPKDEQSKILKKLAKIINEDERNINILLPVRDGLMICYVQ